MELQWRYIASEVPSKRLQSIKLIAFAQRFW